MFLLRSYALDNNKNFVQTLPIVFLLTSVYLVTYGMRVGFSPILPVLEVELNFGHALAGNIFLFIAIGYSTGLISNAMVGAYLRHRVLIRISVFGMSGIFLLLSLSHHYLHFLICIVFGAFFAGLYLPSAMASLTEYVAAKDWNKALAIHELAPNVIFVLSPLLTQILFTRFGWRSLFLFWAVFAFLIGILICVRPAGGNFFAAPFKKENIEKVFSLKAFWVLVCASGICIGAEIGVFAMLPLYLADLGLELAAANEILMYSRMLTLVLTPIGGYVADRFGAAFTVFWAIFLSGIFTAFVGIMAKQYILYVLLLQPVFSAIFFPACFSLLSKLVDVSMRSVAIALLAPAYSILGFGLVPVFLGLMGKYNHFSQGFVIIGIAHFFVLPLVYFVLYKKEKNKI